MPSRHTGRNWRQPHRAGGKILELNPVPKSFSHNQTSRPLFSVQPIKQDTMSSNKFFSRKVYIVPGSLHRFGTENDARLWAVEHNVDPSLIEKYDSKKEYERWLWLQQLQREGKIGGLRRQVEYEIIPAHVERMYVKDSVINDWVVENVHFATQKAAWAYCRAQGLQLSAAFKQTMREPVFKDVTIESRAVYTADFVYYDEDGNEVVEDTKSEVTRKEADYVLRRKLMLHVHGIRVKET